MLPMLKKIHMILKRQVLKTSIITCKENNSTSMFNKSKNLQHFYDQLISSILTSIKHVSPLYFLNYKSRKYPSHIIKLLKGKLTLYKKSKTNKSFFKGYENKSKEYQLAVKKYNFEYE